MKISALFPCSIWQRQESRPRTTGQPAVTPMWVSSLSLPSSCYCHEKRRSCEKAGWEAEESGKQTHMSFPVFSWMGSLLIESERIRAHTYKWCTHTHTPTQKHAWFRAEAHKDKRKNLDPARWRSWRSVSLCWRGAYYDWSSWIPWRSPNPITRGLTYLSAHAVESCLLEEKGPGTRLSPTWVVLSVTIDMFVHLLDPSGTMV